MSLTVTFLTGTSTSTTTANTIITAHPIRLSRPFGLTFLRSRCIDESDGNNSYTTSISHGTSANTDTKDASNSIDIPSLSSLTMRTLLCSICMYFLMSEKSFECGVIFFLLGNYELR